MASVQPLITVNGSTSYAQTWQYNDRGRMTRQTAAGEVDIEYRYSATANDGRITQRKNWTSGEELNYQYDELGRLIAASTTGPEWGLSWTYDGFGNRLAQSVTKGSGTVQNLMVNWGDQPDRDERFCLRRRGQPDGVAGRDGDGGGGV